jgi:hypothetical protein
MFVVLCLILRSGAAFGRERTSSLISDASKPEDLGLMNTVATWLIKG